MNITAGLEQQVSHVLYIFCQATVISRLHFAVLGLAPHVFLTKVYIHGMNTTDISYDNTQNVSSNVDARSRFINVNSWYITSSFSLQGASGF